VRSRCPYCGARRIGRGKYTEDADNSKGKMMISILVLGCLVVAAGILLFTTPIDDAAATPPSIEDPSSLLQNPEDDVDSLLGTNPVPSPYEDPYGDNDPDGLGFPADEPYETEPTQLVQSVALLHQGRPLPDFSANVGERFVFTVRVEPIGLDEEITWTSENRHPDNPAVFEVIENNTEGTEATVTILASGTAYLTVTVGGVTSPVTIVRGR